jgi:hypothetical protein
MLNVEKLNIKKWTSNRQMIMCVWKGRRLVVCKMGMGSLKNQSVPKVSK